MTKVSRRSLLAAGLASGALLATRGGRAGAPPYRPKTLLILGGTGFLGPHLVDAARARGLTITLFNRGKTRPQLFPDLEKLRGDRNGDLRSLEGRFWDAVIDTSGYVPREVTLSAKLLAPKVRQYVFVSTISVYGEDVKKPGMDETSPTAPLTDPKSEDVQKHYGPLKAACERAAEAALAGRVMNVRPGLIVGPGDPTDRFTYWPVRLDRGGEILAPGDGKDPVQVIDARDLAAFIILGLERRLAGVYLATGPARELPMSEVLAACARAAGPDQKRPAVKLTWVPAAFLEKHEVMPWMHMPAWVPGTGDSAGFSRMSVKKSVAAGLTFRPLETTAKDTLAYFQTLPEERRKKPRAGLAPEREAAVLAAFHAAAKKKP
jgi:2'-hydroxyisoflavone reductase